MHVPVACQGVHKEKEKTILERATSHQLIILENPPPINVDDKTSNSQNNTTKTSEVNQSFS